MNDTFYQLDSDEGPYNSGNTFDGGNIRHRPSIKGGYFPVPPVDSMTDMRAEMVGTMMEMGLEMEKHHHEVAPSQNELGGKFDELLSCADGMQKYKYVVHMVAHSYGKTATFMPNLLLTIMALVCTVINLCGKETLLCLLGKNIVACQKIVYFILEVSLSMQKQ